MKGGRWRKRKPCSLAVNVVCELAKNKWKNKKIHNEKSTMKNRWKSFVSLLSSQTTWIHNASVRLLVHPTSEMFELSEVHKVKNNKWNEMNQGLNVLSSPVSQIIKINFDSSYFSNKYLLNTIQFSNILTFSLFFLKSKD